MIIIYVLKIINLERFYNYLLVEAVVVFVVAVVVVDFDKVTNRKLTVSPICLHSS